VKHIGLQPKNNERTLLLEFVGFHSSFNPVWNHITLALRNDFPVAIAESSKGEVPDYLFFSCHGVLHTDPRYDKCVKIYTNEENIRPPWHECDYAMTSDRLAEADCRHLRLPIYATYLKHSKDNTGKTIVKPSGRDLKLALARKTRFCNFVYSNAGAKERIAFFEMLSKYKRVDSGGAVLNNMNGSRVGDKVTFLEEYKFTIAFENSRYPGYISEKIVEPMLSNSIPIYWGCRDVGDDFNPFSFVCANEPEGSNGFELIHHFEQVIRKIVWLDTHDADYVSMMSEPWFHNNEPNIYCQPYYIREFLRRVFNTSRLSLPKRPPSPPPPLIVAPKLTAESIEEHKPSTASNSSLPRGKCWADQVPTTRKHSNVKKWSQG
jgi:hypothetical protein